MEKLILLVCSLLLSWNAAALETAGVNLPEKVQMGEVTLALNGAGIRTKWFFKVYVGALYLTQKETSADVIIADARPHRIALHMLRALGSRKLLEAFNEAIKANHSPEEMAVLDAQLQKMAQIFAAVGEVRRGDVIALDYLPASGTHIMVNGKVYGTIGGATFSRALLKIWLGSKPAQEDLKKGMLGG